MTTELEYFVQGNDYVLKTVAPHKEFSMNLTMKGCSTRADTKGLSVKAQLVLSLDDYTVLGDFMEYHLGYVEKIPKTIDYYKLTAKGIEVKERGGHRKYKRWKRRVEMIPFVSKRISIIAITIAILSFLISTYVFIITYDPFNWHINMKVCNPKAISDSSRANHEIL